MPETVIILGGSGMLGSMCADWLSRVPGLKVAATVRDEALAGRLRERLPEVDWRLFDADAPDPDEALGIIDDFGWVVNAIGITKPLIRDDNPDEVARAVRINALLPYHLARKAENNGAKVIQIATDCVFSGSRGGYRESDPHDAGDAYGQTKSLGEVVSPAVHHLRGSIIAREPKEHKFLVDWFLGQPAGASVSGYTNHLWNGVTTLHFAKICHGIIMGNIRLPHLQHIVPADAVSKYELLRCLGQSFGREDITINPAEADSAVDRTLATEDEALNVKLWEAAGYERPPAVAAMVAELAAFEPRLLDLGK
jgi:dTDP-4-dehydrorhamnose reductase